MKNASISSVFLKQKK